MFLFKKRKGGVELVSIIILVVILGAATISIAVGLSKNAKNTAEGGLSANNSHLSALYQSLEDNLSDISSPGGGGGGEVEYGTAGSAQVLEGYTIATTVGLIEGTMRRNGLIDAELTTQNASYSIPEGYHDGTGKVTASFSNLVAENIKDGVNIGGVVGNLVGKNLLTGSKGKQEIYIGSSNPTLIDTNINFTPSYVFVYGTYKLFHKNSGFSPATSTMSFGGVASGTGFYFYGFLDSSARYNHVKVTFNNTTKQLNLVGTNVQEGYTSLLVYELNWIAIQ